MNDSPLSRFLFLVFLFMAVAHILPLQAQPTVRNPFIREMVDEVSKDSIQKNIEKLVSYGTRHALSDTISDTRGIGAARRWVLSRFKAYAARSNGRMTARLDPFIVEKGPRVPHRVTMKNTMAILEGDDPEGGVLVVSGHIDSRVTDVMDSTSEAPGANDDASGVALVMELARIMSSRKFDATIIFVAVQGEEQGLLGAAHLAETLAADSSDVIAMFNNDMVGNTQASEIDRNSAKRLRLFSEPEPASETEEQARLRSYTGAENDSPSRQLARYIKSTGEAYVDDFEVTLNYRIDRYLRGGDHLPFTRQGFTAVRFCEMNENYLHQHQDIRVEHGEQYGDLPEYVNFAYTANIARVNLAALAELALAPRQPQNVGIKVELGNISTLTWDPPKTGKKPAGYVVLLRETYESMWQKSFQTAETEIELPYSKDNYFFAVQAVDRDGNKSLPVFPVPKR